MHIIDLSKNRGFGARLTRGRELAGEDRVAGVLAKLLDDSYYLIRHFVLPGDRYDLNMVLVGPAGVWQFEILHFGGLVKTEGGWMHWDYKEQGLRPVPYELISRTGDKVARLTNYLAEQGLPGLEINQAIILSTPNAPRDFTLPGLQVAFLDEVEELIKTAQTLFSPANPVPVAEIAHLLGGVDLPESAPDSTAPQTIRWGMTRTQILILMGLSLGDILVLFALFAAVVYYGF